MNVTALSLERIRELAYNCLAVNGCDHDNASALADTLTDAERDGCNSHGLFRMGGYVAGLRSGKVKGAACPKLQNLTSSALRMDGDGGYAPLALQQGCPALAKAAHAQGVAVLALVRSFHFASLWHEAEALAAEGLVALCCTAYMPSVAPAGSSKPFFGTNPLCFAWPRPQQTPVVYDMATASMAKGEVMIAARDGHKVPLGTGLDCEGRDTEYPQAILDGGVLLPFGGYKGSALSLMVELLSAGLMGENFSDEAKEADNGDGAPARGGEFLLAMSPQKLAGSGWAEHSQAFFTRLEALGGTRLPGSRRHQNRAQGGNSREIDQGIIDRIKTLTETAVTA